MFMVEQGVSMERVIVLLCLFFISPFSSAREPLSENDIAGIIDEFQYENNYTEVSSKQSGGNWDSCWTYEKVIQVDYPGMTEPLRVNLVQFIPNRNRLGEEQIPAVIMIPPIGGMNMLDRRMAETFCSSRMSALVLTDDFAYIEAQSAGSLRPPEDHQETFYRVGAAVKGSMAMIAADNNLDYEKVGIFGVSLGGVLGSFMMATQVDVAAGYFIVAGGDIPHILAVSQQTEVARIRRKRMQAEGLENQQAYEEYLRQHIFFDPLDLAITMMPETINMVVAQRDSSVPTPNQMSLYEAFGQPETRFINSGHVDAVISALFWANNRRDVARFFSQRFALPNPRPQAFDFLNQLNSWWAAN
jgi:dienelactone hydrolase